MNTRLLFSAVVCVATLCGANFVGISSSNADELPNYDYRDGDWQRYRAVSANKQFVVDAECKIDRIGVHPGPKHHGHVHIKGSIVDVATSTVIPIPETLIQEAQDATTAWTKIPRNEKYSSEGVSFEASAETQSKLISSKKLTICARVWVKIPGGNARLQGRGFSNTLVCPEFCVTADNATVW